MSAAELDARESARREGYDKGVAQGRAAWNATLGRLDAAGFVGCPASCGCSSAARIARAI